MTSVKIKATITNMCEFVLACVYCIHVRWMKFKYFEMWNLHIMMYWILNIGILFFIYITYFLFLYNICIFLEGSLDIKLNFLIYYIAVWMMCAVEVNIIDWYSMKYLTIVLYERCFFLGNWVFIALNIKKW